MQLLFLQDLWTALKNQFTSIFLPPVVKDKNAIPKDPQEQSCGSNFFRKLKFHSNHEDTIWASEQQDIVKGFQEQATVLEFVIKEHPSKTINVRKSTMILDYFGIIGGFNAALNLLFGRFCRFFSGNFLQAAVAQDLYIKKRSKKEISKN